MDMSNVMRHLQRKYKQHLACNSEFTRNYYDAMVIVHRLMKTSKSSPILAATGGEHK